MTNYNLKTIIISIVIILNINLIYCLEIIIDYYSTQSYNNSQCGILSLNEPPCTSLNDTNNRILKEQSQRNQTDNSLIISFIYSENLKNEINDTVYSKLDSIDPLIYNNIIIQLVIYNSYNNKSIDSSIRNDYIKLNDTKNKRIKINGDMSQSFLNFTSISNSSFSINIKIDGIDFSNFFSIVLIGEHMGSLDYSNCNFFKVYYPLFSILPLEKYNYNNISFDYCNYTQTSDHKAFSLKQIRDNVVISKSFFSMNDFIYFFYSKKVIVKNTTFLYNRNNKYPLIEISKINNLELSNITFINNREYNNLITLEETRYLNNKIKIENIIVYNNFINNNGNNSFIQLTLTINSLDFGIKNLIIIKSNLSTSSSSLKESTSYSNLLSIINSIYYPLNNYKYYIKLENITSNYPFNNLIITDNSYVYLGKLDLECINNIVIGSNNIIYNINSSDNSINNSSNDNDIINNNKNNIIRIIIPVCILFVIISVSISIFLIMKHHQNKITIQNIENQQRKLQQNEIYYKEGSEISFRDSEGAKAEVLTVKSCSSYSNFSK